MSVMKRLLEWLDKMEGRKEPRANHIVAFAFMSLLALAGIGSGTAIFFQDQLFEEPKNKRLSLEERILANCSLMSGTLEAREEQLQQQIDSLTVLGAQISTQVCKAYTPLQPSNLSAPNTEHKDDDE